MNVDLGQVFQPLFFYNSHTCNRSVLYGFIVMWYNMCHVCTYVCISLRTTNEVPEVHDGYFRACLPAVLLMGQQGRVPVVVELLSD